MGTTILLTSHDVADIEHVADRAVIVNHGRIIHDAPVADMRSSLLARKQIVLGFEDETQADTVAQIESSDIEVERVGPLSVRVQVDTRQRPVRDVLDEILRLSLVADMTVVDPPLEQIIGEIYEQPS